MTNDSELTRAVRAFLEEGADRLPDRVFQAVMDGVPTAPQRRHAWLPRRTHSMPSALKLILVAAATVLLGAAAFALLPGGGQPAPTPGPSPSSVPSQGPSAPAASLGVRPVPAAGDSISAGTYLVGDPFPAPFEITFPAGWSVAALRPGEVGFGGGAGRYVGVFTVQDVIDDPCHPGASADPSAAALDADQLYGAFKTMAGVKAEDAGDTVLNGVAARHLVISNTIDTATAGCEGGLMLPLFVPVGGEAAATNGGTTQDLWILDTPVRPLLVVAEGPRETAAERAQVNGVVGSITLR